MSLSQQNKTWNCILCTDNLEDRQKMRFLKTNYRIEARNGNHARICNDCYNSAHNPARKGSKVHA